MDENKYPNYRKGYNKILKEYNDALSDFNILLKDVKKNKSQINNMDINECRNEINHMNLIITDINCIRSIEKN